MNWVDEDFYLLVHPPQRLSVVDVAVDPVVVDDTFFSSGELATSRKAWWLAFSVLFCLGWPAELLTVLNFFLVMVDGVSSLHRNCTRQQQEVESGHFVGSPSFSKPSTLAS